MNLLKKVCRRVFRAHQYLLFKAACPNVVVPDGGEGERVVVLDAASIDTHGTVCEALRTMSRTAADYLDDVRTGRAVALVILSRGKVVHFSYVFLRNKSACILGLDEETALVGNAFTVPSYRGRGCQSRSVALRAAIARERGFAFIAAETSPDNGASQRGLQNGGMRLVGRLDLLVILNSLVIRWRRPSGFALLGFCVRV